MRQVINQWSDENINQWSDENIENDLQNWINKKGIDESQINNRNKAAEKIKKCAFSQNYNNFPNYKNLDLSNLLLTSLPDSILSLNLLTQLYLQGNQLETLPDSIGVLQSLNSLNLSNNQLSTIPNSIGGLQSLNSLNLSNNQLSTIPNSIGGLRSLKFLNLSNNQLSTIPNSIGDLQSLKFLNLSNNQLKTIPNSMINLRNNDFYINLNGNSQELNNVSDYQSLSQYLEPKIEVGNRIDAFVKLTNPLLNTKIKIPVELKTYIAGFAYSIFPTEPDENNLNEYIEYIENEIPILIEETIKSFLNEVNIISLVDRDSEYLVAQERVKENSKNLNQNQQIVASSPQFIEYLTNYIAKAYEKKSKELKQENTIKEESEDENMPLKSISLSSLSQLNQKPSYKEK